MSVTSDGPAPSPEPSVGAPEPSLGTPEPPVGAPERSPDPSAPERAPTPPTAPAPGLPGVPPPVPAAEAGEDAAPGVPYRIPTGLDVAAGIAWRLLFVAAAAFAVIVVADTLALVVVPVVIALITTSLLAPEAHLLSSRVRWMPHALATALVIVGGLALVAAVFYGVVVSFVSGLPELSSQLSRSVTEIQDWLRDGPLALNNEQFAAIGQQVVDAAAQSQAQIAAGALGAVSTFGELLTEGLLTLFVVIFFVHDGGRVWGFLLRGVPGRARARADVAGRRAFSSLVGYTRAIVVVAAIDAVTAGIGLWLIGVPLAVPLATLIFFGAFVPTLGAVVTGAVAALVALVSGGVTDMLLVILLLLAVQNLEGYILQPLFLGRSINLHPLAVVLPIACGLVLAGIPGALLAVPVVTVLDASVRSLTRPSDAHVDPATVNPLDPRSARGDDHPVERTRPGLVARAGALVRRPARGDRTDAA